MLRETGAKAVELSALRAAELDPLMESLDGLDLNQFSFKSVHAANRTVDAQHEPGTWWTSCIGGCPSVAGPSWLPRTPFTTMALWRPFGKLVCIEKHGQAKAHRPHAGRDCARGSTGCRGILVPGSAQSGRSIPL